MCKYRRASPRWPISMQSKVLFNAFCSHTAVTSHWRSGANTHYILSSCTCANFEMVVTCNYVIYVYQRPKICQCTAIWTNCGSRLRKSWDIITPFSHNTQNSYHPHNWRFCIGFLTFGSLSCRVTKPGDPSWHHRTICWWLSFFFKLVFMRISSCMD